MVRGFLFAMLLLAGSTLAQPALAFLSLVRQGAESDDVPNADDRFGRAVCAGDFDGDGFDDLAAAAPDESNGLINSAAHGMVIISRGTARGISMEGAKEINVGDFGTDAVRFGWSLVAADFDQDNYDDLAVGIPQYDTLGGQDRGAFYVYRGGPGGLELAPYLQVFHDQVAFVPEQFSQFGWALTSGDFNDDGFPDIATSAIGEEADTGVVYFFFGGGGGISTTGYQFLLPFTAGGSDALGSWFGYSLQAGQFDGVGGDDIAIGAPKTDVLGQVDAGRVYLYYAGGNGINSGSGIFFDASNLASVIPPGDAELGFSLAAGHFFQVSGMMDLAVGAPQADVNSQSAAGAVLLLEFDSGPVTTKKLIAQSESTDTTSAAAGDQFGYALAAGKFDIGNYEDLAIGAPFENVTEQTVLGSQGNAGMFHVLYGRQFGPTMSESETFDAKTLNNFVNASDLLGQALCFGSFDNSSRQSVAAGAPGADYDSYEDGEFDISNAGQVHIAAPWRQPKNHPHRSSVLLDCDGFIVYGQRPFQRVRPASTTKTMTLLLACEAIQNALVNPDQFYNVPGWVADSVGGSQTPLVEGESLKFVGLIQTMMTVSGNDSAMLIGSILSGDGGPWEGWEDTSPAFAVAMDAKANQLGLSSATSLTNAAGIDAGDHYVTALDWASLAYQAIQNDCVRTIVSQTSWIVERVLPDGSSLDFFTLDGEGPGDISMFELFFASWVDGVMDRYAGTVGIKPGSTPGGWVTGLSAGDPGQFVPGFTAASSFGSRRTDVPVEGVVAGCSTCLHGDLLQFGEGFCSGGNPGDFTPTPDPGPQPWNTLTGIPPCPEQAIHAMTINLADEQAVAPGRTVQIDLMRSGHTAPQNDARQLVSRSSQFLLSGFEIVNFGIAPHQSNLGLRITNEGEGQADFRVHWNGKALAYKLQPGEAATIPGVSATTNDFSFWLELLQRSEANLGVEELGYTYEHTLLDGISGPDSATLILTRDGHLLAENITVQVRGMNDDCGDDELDLVARPDDRVSTSVPGETGPLPPAPAAFRLLPNYPNPFNPSTTIRFDFPRPATADLLIFDVRGRRVKTLAQGRAFDTGRHQLRWDGTNDAGASVASGVYILQLTSEGKQENQRMILLK